MVRNEVITNYDEIVTLANLERKGKTTPYASANGYMFSLINKDDEMGIRLSKEDTREFEKYGALPFKSHGAIMREYVLIHTPYYKIRPNWLNTLKRDMNM
ncbi:hypothetical protein [Croceitalea rosinachiae]|uniref:Uncharacterized protein n=1 Tax=Croceitalea rosinachiae TaxID=3075596 RepID=A0ABU3AG43_9FLAO|nr:hypothetical protein [Croceitalea sp. F388]MDT0608083.1 hypothetical protein [Croceitalea sp. F388]